jgi:hypothetical protein
MWHPLELSEPENLFTSPRKSRDHLFENGRSVSIQKSTGRKDLYENVFVVAVLLETEHSWERWVFVV